MKWESKETRVDVEWNRQIDVKLQLFIFLFSKYIHSASLFRFSLSVHYLCPKMQNTKAHSSFTPCSLQFIFLNLKHSTISLQSCTTL